MSGAGAPPRADPMCTHTDLAMVPVDEVKSAAYVEWAGGGTKHFMACFRSAPAADLEAWVEEFRRVDRFLWDFPDVRVENAHEAFAASIRQAFPFMNEAAVRTAWYWTNYYAWHG